MLHLLDDVLAHSRCLLTTASAAHSLAGGGSVRGSAGPAGEALCCVRAVLLVHPTSHLISSCSTLPHLKHLSLHLTTTRASAELVHSPTRDRCTLLPPCIDTKLSCVVCVHVSPVLCIGGAASCQVRAMLGSCVVVSCHHLEHLLALFASHPPTCAPSCEHQWHSSPHSHLPTTLLPPVQGPQ